MQVILVSLTLGPNAVIYLPEENVGKFLGLINYYFPKDPTQSDSEYFSSTLASRAENVDEYTQRIKMGPIIEGKIKRIIHTRVGGGPQVLAREYVEGISLFDSAPSLA